MMASKLVRLGFNYQSSTEYRNTLQLFIETVELNQVCDILYASIKNESVLSFTVSFPILVNYNSVVAYQLCNYPKPILSLFYEALMVVQKKVLQSQQLVAIKGSGGSIKARCPVRIVGLPPMLTKRSKLDFECA